MYPILRYMWGTDTYRESIKVRMFLVKPKLSYLSFAPHKPQWVVIQYWNVFFLGWDLQDLADYASKNLEAMNPPLFLRFLNLLMNDAIFLLDEAIQVKKQTKKQI